MRGPLSLRRDQSGSASAEMALMIPMLLALMFTCMEAGLYLFTEHKVVKGVHDGARYAARQNFQNYDATVCSSGTVGTTLQTQIQNVTAYGEVTVSAGDKPRVSTWTVPDTSGQSYTKITVTCPSYTTGIYSTLTYAPVVTVSAKVKYPSLFSTITGLPTSIFVGASDQASVMGV